jgi:2,3-bisphosphoglycerate-dependent phosphoglycerate mutase
MHIEGLSAEAMEHVEIASGVPLVYRFAPDLAWESKAWLA